MSHADFHEVCRFGFGQEPGNEVVDAMVDRGRQLEKVNTGVLLALPKGQLLEAFKLYRHKCLIVIIIHVKQLGSAVGHHPCFERVRQVRLANGAL